MLVGELTSIKQALLPIVAAIGGMVIPVLLFMYIGRGSDFLRGSAIPMATDIAFSLGVLAMLGKRVPISLKIFLTTLEVYWLLRFSIPVIYRLLTCFMLPAYF